MFYNAEIHGLREEAGRNIIHLESQAQGEDLDLAQRHARLANLLQHQAAQNAATACNLLNTETVIMPSKSQVKELESQKIILTEEARNNREMLEKERAS